MSILSKIQNKEAVIGVVGLGYVGLPLNLANSRVNRESLHLANFIV